MGYTFTCLSFEKKTKRGPKDNSLNVVAGRHFAVRGIHVYVYILANLRESNERGPKDNPVHAVTWDTCLHVYPYESLRSEGQLFERLIFERITRRGPRDNSLNAVASWHFAVSGIHVYVYILANL